MKKYLAFMVLSLLTLGLTVPALAYHFEPTTGVGVDIYSSIGLSTELRSTDYSSYQESTAGGSKEDASVYAMNHSSTFGVNLKQGNFFGKFEVGFTNHASMYSLNTTQQTDTIYARLLYGSYKFDDLLTLTVGQAYNPSYWWTNSESKDGNAGYGFGNHYDQRTPMIRLDIGPGYLIAEKVYEHGKPSGSTAKVNMPKFYAGFDTKIDKHAVGAGFGYQSYKVTEQTTNSLDKEDLISWTAFIHGQAQITDKIYLKSQIYHAQNVKQMGVEGQASTAAVQINSSLDGFDNTKTTAGFLMVQADMGKIRPFAGYGYSVSKNTQYSNKDAQQEYYAGAAVDIWKSEFARLHVVPEVHMFDRMKDKNGEKEEKELVAGARWKLSF